MWSYFFLLQMSLAAELSTDCSLSRRRAGSQAVAAVYHRPAHEKIPNGKNGVISTVRGVNPGWLGVVIPPDLG